MNILVINKFLLKKIHGRVFLFSFAAKSEEGKMYLKLLSGSNAGSLERICAAI